MCRTGTARSTRGTRFLGIGIIFALALGLPAAAQAQQDVCNAPVNIELIGGPAYLVPGDIVRVRLGLGAGTITGGAANELTVSKLRYELDCLAPPTGIGCLDEGDIFRYVGDGTITVEGCGGAGWTSDGTDSPATKQVTFTPSAPVVIPANTAATSNFCRVEFDVRLQTAPGNDGTPNVVQVAAGYLNGVVPADAMCDQDPAIEGTGGGTGQIRLCIACDDGDACTTESCNQTSGQCETTFTQTCDDGDACTTEACNTATGACETSFTQTCDDGDACTTEACNTATGACETSFTQTCGDGDACTTEICNTSTGQCQTTNTQTCDDGDACTTEACNTATGACETSFTQTCDDGDACTTEACNTATGACETSFTQVCNDGDACTTEACNTATGACETSFTVTCPDPNCEVCNTTTGVCEDIVPPPSICVAEEICRTPGFWKTHAGSEKDGPNVTGAVLAAAAVPVMVCGDLVSTSVDVMENMCVAVRGDPFVQLKRQLTAAALNCIMSTPTGDPTCGGVSIETTFGECNSLCSGGPSTLSASECIGMIDDFNNGLISDCHDQPLCNEDLGVWCDKTGPASSPKQCSEIFKANK